MGCAITMLLTGGSVRCEGREAVVSSGFLYETAPYPSCHASTIAEVDGALVASWFGGTHERHPDVGIWVARNEGEGWSEPIEVANGVFQGERYPSWNPVLFQPSAGPLLLFYKVGPTPQDWWGMLIKSEDGGFTWSEPQRLPDEVLGPIKNKPIELEGGVLLCPSSSEHDGWRVHFERTADHGKTWEVTPPVNDPENIRAIQPSLLRHGDGVLQAIGRTRDSGVFQVWSCDNGRTWGEMSTTGLPNPSSGTDAVTLADGRHLLVYNHNPNYKGRSPLNVAISDDGKSWRAALVLEDDKEHDAGYSYPAVIQSSDGLVHITYTWRRERIKHVVLDPKQLDGPPITGDEWPNAEAGVE
ncbi:sialidase family protein [Botrimarina mediterranea]|uniref:sialidase family protein n=1 Tax=Botrimarina mediterranea TaxID=2528022 RepID=UPI00118AB771|nr:hypothetical protein K2D_26490 [Planctomycetes bacterium K2D]